ncbi:MAG TPA: hybrid sensor histidine kinase/response regulator [Xanthomonadaceae bacterium]|nr:hybrid sensor histidine kinase/response regulator [Xanthomonadaceae bacterium]
MKGIKTLLMGRDPVVLVVDDQEANLRLVGTVLTQAGFDVMPALSGEKALTRVSVRVPDVILLDMMMPGIDGFELARRLRADPATSEVPVIFLTAAHEREHLVRAFESGAVDYVTKPFMTEELIARLRTHLELKLIRDHYARVAKEREELASLVAHDLKNPLSGIRLAAELITKDEPSVQRCQRLAEVVLTSVDDALSFINRYLERRAEGELLRQLRREPMRLDEAVRRALERFALQAETKQIDLRVDAMDPLTVAADDEAVMHVLDNLLSNAIKYSHVGGEVSVSTGPGAPGMGRVLVMDRGPGLSRTDQKKLFQRFVRLSSQPTGQENSSGLGLALAKQDVSRMGGELWHEERPGGGAVFAFELPLEGEGAPAGRGGGVDTDMA